MKFRHDINLLRAVAVILVVLYHFSVPGFSAGYIGVDIFFVISGYLITGIISTAGPQFSYLSFYKSRARRILPALIFLCVVLMLYGWFKFSPSVYANAALHTVSSLLFFSNFIYWGEHGYFDVASHGKWLLHTWSLSVEWQFYLIYPLLISLAVKWFSKKYLKYFIALTCLISFGLCWFFSEQEQSSAFYLLPMRAWEMLVGGLAFYWSVEKRGDVLKIITLLGLLSFAFFNGEIGNWPGVVSTVPVLLAFLFISFKSTKFNFTGGRFFSFIGEISYSFYLWHWPFAILSYGMSWEYKATALLAAFSISCFSYYFVENPFRKNKNIFPIALGVLLVLATFASVVYFKDGIPSRSRSDVVAIDKERKNKNPLSEKCNVYPKNTSVFPACIYGGDGKRVALIVVGDSHSNAIVTAVAQAFGPTSGGVLFMGADGCRPLISWHSEYFKDCANYNEQVMERLTNKYSTIPVLVISRTTSALLAVPPGIVGSTPSSDPNFSERYLSLYKESLCRLSVNRKVYVLGQIPEMPNSVPDNLISSINAGVDNTAYSSVSEYRARHAVLNRMLDSAAKGCGVTYLDVIPYMCEAGKCNGVEKGLPLYYDDTHLTESGNKKLVPLFKRVF